MTERWITLPESNVDKLERQFAERVGGLQRARAVTTGRVTEREVRRDEVGAVLVSVRRRRTTHVYHLRICASQKRTSPTYGQYGGSDLRFLSPQPDTSLH